MNRRRVRILLGIIAVVMLADFVFRGLVPALTAGKTDFSEVYVGAWLWRHGQNFYDAALATQTASRLTRSNMPIAVLYPPTAFPLIAPLTFLPWGWANLVWLLLALFGIGVTIAVLIRLGRFQRWDDRTLILVTFVLAFAPLHQAFHLGNIALVAVPLCLLGIDFAERGKDFTAGAILAVSMALKPQLGIWILAFYCLQRPKRFLAGALGPAIVLTILLITYPIHPAELISGYQRNFQYWMGPGRPFGFTDGAYPFHVNNVQVVLYQLLHNASVTNALAHTIFLCCLVIWSFAVWRRRFRVSAPLAVSSLVALSFISLYHTVNDVTFLTLALCWAYGSERQFPSWPKRVTCIIFLILMLPGHSVLMRSAPHLSAWMTESWWWKLLVARYFVWVLLALNGALLYALATSAHSDNRTGARLQATSVENAALPCSQNV